MALEATFRKLAVQLRKLQDTFVALQLTIGDKPPEREAALADNVENTILDMLGLLQNARKATKDAQQAVGHPLDLDRARRAMTTCHEQFHQVEQQFSAELSSYELLKDLTSLAESRRGEWIPWANSMKDGISQCREPMQETSQSLAECWQEIAEHAGTTSVSVRTTNIGQKITRAVPVSEAVDDAIP
jgi:hypothetical protein